MSRSGICPHIDRQGRSCPELTPCPVHPARPRNAHWSSDRSSTTQARFRAMLIARDGLRCRRCGAAGVALQAHHDTPTDGRLLCRDCHRAVDPDAR
jgi:hypothetical protein